MRLPGGTTMGIYEPRHASPLAAKQQKKTSRARRKSSP
jgi:hypothetical protein